MTGRRPPFLVAVAVLAATATAVASGVQPVLQDGCEDLAPWSAAPADGVTMALSQDSGNSGPGLRLDYDFGGHAGWAIARRDLAVVLPEHWQLSFWLRGTPAVQTLEVKLLDRSGENVWWSVRRGLELGPEWRRIVVKKRQLSFAWGPAGGGELGRPGSLELAIVPGDGGAGTVWIDGLKLEATFPPRTATRSPAAVASSAEPGKAPPNAVDGRSDTCWHNDPRAPDRPWLQLDHGVVVELGGLVVDWDPTARPAAFSVETSKDGASWTTRWSVPSGRSVRSWVPLPETECRFVRLWLDPAAAGTVGVCEVVARELAFTATPNEFMAEVALAAPRGHYPRGLLGEMTAWTLVGPSCGGDRRGLLGADGGFEPVARSGSLEPFVWLDDRLIGWADVESEQSLVDDRLPIPTVTWRHPRFELSITAIAEDERTTLLYRLTNRAAARIEPQLVIALRPFQVDPPSQILNGPGGTAALPSTSCRALGLAVADVWSAAAAPATERCGAVPFDGGDVVAWLSSGDLPGGQRAGPPYPSAAAVWDLALDPGESREVALEVVPGEGAAPPDEPAAERLERVAAKWRERLIRVDISGPPAAADALDTLYANLGFMLINRDGPALQPGARAYARSWIRDGAMMAAALLRLGHGEAAARFARWFADHQYDDGKVPCCVDRRGADPVPENDADGELIFLVAETVRLTGDLGFAKELWPHVDLAAAHLDGLRARRRTETWLTTENRVFFGLVPESISHEGYSAKPMHSYWDDYWALRGFADASELAQRLGHQVRARELATSAEEMRADVVASLELAMQLHGIDYLPGCAELGDLDPTSTTVAVAPTAVDRWLPAAALAATFERGWESFVARRDGVGEWKNYTPYELRNAAVWVRLGRRDRAWQLLEFYLDDRQPAAWRQWPEIVWRDPHAARFLGDLPHTWVGSDYVRSLLDAFAWEREADAALVVAGGLPRTWLADEGIAVCGLVTRWGQLSYTLREAGGVIRFRLESGLAVPPGGIVVQLPLGRAPASVRVNGRLVAPGEKCEIVLHGLPADVEVVP